MIQVSNLTKCYGTKKALDNINFKIDKGELLGFLGPNGAGKSTTMNIMTGYIAPTSGSVVVDGYEIFKKPLEVKSRIGYLPEHPPLYFNMTVKEYLNFIYNLKKLKKSNFNKKSHILEVCEKVGITDIYNRMIKNLSKGYKQRVGIAQAILGYPPVIILDEPTVGLDPKQIIYIRELIKGLAKNHTVILSSHILSEIQAICNRIIVINQGKIVADGSTAEISNRNVNNNAVLIKTDCPEDRMVDISRMTGGVSIEKCTLSDNGIFEYIINVENSNLVKNISKCLIENDFSIIKLEKVEHSLEDLFLKLINSTDKQISDYSIDKQEFIDNTTSGDSLIQDIDENMSNSEGNDIASEEDNNIQENIVDSENKGDGAL